MRWTRASAIAFVLLAIVLGHDVLMAADPHQAEVDQVLIRIGAHAMPDTDGGDASLTSVSLLQSVCPASDTARTTPQTLPFDGPPIIGVVPVVVLMLADLTEETVRNHIPPGSPPAVRRALLQVFLN